MYPLIRRLFFRLDPEKAHQVAMQGLKAACAVPGGVTAVKALFSFPQNGLPQHVFGLNFRNPVGLGAGFDKNAAYLTELEALGFGFVEIGTVTPRPQAGNDQPRLFRLVQDGALINRMGFNNDGVEAVAARLKAWRKKDDRWKMEDDSSNLAPSSTIHHPSSFLIGGNIGKNKATPNEEAWKDYEICFKSLHPYVDFFVVNVSSPNTPGLRELQERDALHKILTHLQGLNKGMPVQRPILLKNGPDLTWTQIDDVISLALEISLDGLVATNTTTSRKGLKTSQREIEKMGAGGLSGIPLRERATEVVQYLCSRLQGQIPVIASGGIFTAADAAEKLGAGAALCEVWTGFIYEGPGIAKQICTGLLPKRVAAHG